MELLFQNCIKEDIVAENSEHNYLSPEAEAIATKQYSLPYST